MTESTKETVKGWGCGLLVIANIVVMTWYGCTKFWVPSALPAGKPADMSQSDYDYVNGRFRKAGMDAVEADKATRTVNEANHQRNGK